MTVKLYRATGRVAFGVGQVLILTPDQIEPRLAAGTIELVKAATKKLSRPVQVRCTGLVEMKAGEMFKVGGKLPRSLEDLLEEVDADGNPVKAEPDDDAGEGSGESDDGGAGEGSGEGDDGGAGEGSGEGDDGTDAS